MPSTHSGSPVILFRAPARPWALVVATALSVAVLLPLAVLFAVLGVVADSATGTVLGLGACVLILLLGCLLVVSARQRFTVTIAGIDVASFLRTQHLPWSSIRLVRVGPPTVFSSRATELVLADDSTVRPFATSMNFALWRGETPLSHGADGTAPTRCTLAAIDAHRRCLAGEFGR